MQGGALGDSHVVTEKVKRSGFVGRANGKTNGWRVYQFGPQNWRSSGAWAWRPMDKCVAAGGSSMRLDGLRTDRATLGGIQAAGSFGRMDDTWRHREACIEAKRSQEGGMGVRCIFLDLVQNAPAWACIVSVSCKGIPVISRMPIYMWSG